MGIVVPVYNEAATIERSVEAVADVARRYPGPARVIAVDDASADDSAAILEGLEPRVDVLEVVRHEPTRATARRCGPARGARRSSASSTSRSWTPT